jgi:hypothetical protein
VNVVRPALILSALLAASSVQAGVSSGTIAPGRTVYWPSQSGAPWYLATVTGDLFCVPQAGASDCDLYFQIRDRVNGAWITIASRTSSSNEERFDSNCGNTCAGGSIRVLIRNLAGGSAAHYFFSYNNPSGAPTETEGLMEPGESLYFPSSTGTVWPSRTATGRFTPTPLDGVPVIGRLSFQYYDASKGRWVNRGVDDFPNSIIHSQCAGTCAGKIVRWRAFSDPSISLTEDPPVPNGPDAYVFSH